MRRRVHGLELVQADPGVDLGGLDVCMTEELLDETEVGAALEHERCGGVTEEMTASPLVDAGGFDGIPDELS